MESFCVKISQLIWTQNKTVPEGYHCIALGTHSVPAKLCKVNVTNVTLGHLFHLNMFECSDGKNLKQYYILSKLLTLDQLKLS